MGESNSSSADPVPYTTYQFQVEAENSAGDVSSDYSAAVTTLTESESNL